MGVGEGKGSRQSLRQELQKMLARCLDRQGSARFTQVDRRVRNHHRPAMRGKIPNRRRRSVDQDQEHRARRRCSVYVGYFSSARGSHVPHSVFRDRQYRSRALDERRRGFARAHECRSGRPERQRLSGEHAERNRERLCPEMGRSALAVARRMPGGARILALLGSRLPGQPEQHFPRSGVCPHLRGLV